MASEVEKIIDPDDGSGTDYTSLSAWEAGEAADIVTADEQHTATCRCTSGTADTTTCVISASWTTDSTHYIKIWTDPDEAYRHNGTYETGNHYRMEISADEGISTSSNDTVYVIGLQIQITASSVGWYAGVQRNVSSSGYVYVEKCVFKGVFSGTAQACRGIYCASGFGTNQGMYVSNCVAYDFDGGSGVHFGFHGANSWGCVFWLYNCTVHNCDTGFHAAGNNPITTIKNCVAQDCDTACFSSNWDTASHNCSDDSTEPGSDGQDGEVLFANEGADDFHLGTADTVAKGNGTDLSGDGTLPITDDVDRNSRTLSSVWDIGFDRPRIEIITIVDPDDGGGTDYTSLSSWESGEAADLQAEDLISTAKCRCTGGTADSSACVLSASWTTDADNYIKIWTDDSEAYRHVGIYPTGNKYRLENSSGLSSIDFGSSAGHVKVIGLAIKPSDQDNSIAIDAEGGSGWNYIEQCVIKGDFGVATDTNKAIKCTTGASEKFISNTIIYDFLRANSRGISCEAAGSIGMYLHNNTIHNCVIGYYVSTNVPLLKNCVAQDCSTACYSAASSFNTNCTNNCSDDSTEPGSDGQDGEVLFDDEGADDFHLSPGDVVARDNGATLSGDSDYPITIDIDGETRSPSWDIGADEVFGTAHEGTATVAGKGFIGDAIAVMVRGGSATGTGYGLVGDAIPDFTLGASSTATGYGLLGDVIPVLTLGGTGTGTGYGLVGDVISDLTLGGSATVTGVGLLGDVAPNLTLSGVATVTGVGLLGDIIGVISDLTLWAETINVDSAITKEVSMESAILKEVNADSTIMKEDNMESAIMKEVDVDSTLTKQIDLVSEVGLEEVT